MPEAAGAPRERADHLWSPDLAELRRQWEDWDHGFALWVVSRNAYTLLTEPSRLFGEGPCFPFPKPLALGHPAVTQGILAAPAYAATGNPIASYNSIMILASFLAALAMYLLVRDWTGSPGAGIAAGLLYAFHGARISLATYPFIIDLAWTLFALRFGERYFKQGRWRDALLAALCIALQLCMSLYASLVCVLVLLPYLVWLLTKYGLAKLRPGPVIVALVVIGFSTALVYAPYLGLPETSGNRFRYVALWSGFLPGRFVGWLIFLFALVSLLPGYRESGASRRWALLAACALVLWLATGGNEAAQRIAEKAGDPAPLALPSPYRILDFLPGLDSDSRPLRSGQRCPPPALDVGGPGGCTPDPMDTAPLEAGHLGRTDLRRIRGYAPPGALGRRAPVEFRTLALRRWEQDAREFFETLEELGNRGPVVEIPSGPPWELHRESSRTLLNAYHHRPTSGCHNSVIPPEVRRVRTLTDRLPDADALRELRSLGFTTLVVHGGPPIQRPFRAVAEQSELLEEIHATFRMAAYSILP